MNVNQKRIKMSKLSFFLAITLLSINPLLGSTFKTSDDVLIDYTIIGSGETLVMLHSGMMSRDDMQLQISYFSKNYQVLAVDSREQGRSTESPTQISYQLMSNDLIELLDHLKINRVNIFGQSDGGITALLTTYNHPERITKLIIHGAVYHYTGYSVKEIEAMKKISWDADNPMDNDINRFPGMAIESYLLGRNDLSGFKNHIQEMARMWSSSPTLTVQDLNKIKVPTLVIVGDHWDISLQHTIEMHQALANSQLFVAPGATHFIHKEKPKLLNKVMQDFLLQKH
jgi:pimeloyl-ACP methyl ester carboxylesterase